MEDCKIQVKVSVSKVKHRTNAQHGTFTTTSTPRLRLIHNISTCPQQVVQQIPKSTTNGVRAYM